jgi:integrase
VYVLDGEEIARLRAALYAPHERLLIELAITTGLRSGEIRGGSRLTSRASVSSSSTRRPGAGDDVTKTESSLRRAGTGLSDPETKRWKLACPVTAHGLVFPGEPNEKGERGPIDADKLLRNILRRALRREILGHADVRATLAIYTHAMRREHDDSADKMAELAGLAQCGN